MHFVTGASSSLVIMVVNGLGQITVKVDKYIFTF